MIYRVAVDTALEKGGGMGDMLKLIYMILYLKL